MNLPFFFPFSFLLFFFFFFNECLYPCPHFFCEIAHHFYISIWQVLGEISCLLFFNFIVENIVCLFSDLQIWVSGGPGFYLSCFSDEVLCLFLFTAMQQSQDPVDFLHFWGGSSICSVNKQNELVHTQTRFACSFSPPQSQRAT